MAEVTPVTPKMTINEAMVLMKVVRGRLGELYKKVTEPLYDLKVVDKKCTELSNFLLIVEQKVKQSNAITKISVDFDVKELLSPLT